MNRQLERFILSAYGKKKSGESTLEMPTKTLAITCVSAFVLAFVSATIFLKILESSAAKSLSQKSISVNVVKGSKSHDEIKLEQLKKLLPPDIKRKIQSGFDSLNAYEGLLVKDTITYQQFLNYLLGLSSKGIEIDSAKLTHYITGEIEIDRELVLFYPNYLYHPTPDILESIGLSKPNLETSPKGELNEVVRYGVVANLINKFRQQLGNNYSSSRRLMQALGADIQFITFWFAIWALLLIGLRFFWCLIQKNIIVEGKLQNDERKILIQVNGKDQTETASIWIFDNLDNPSESILSDYRVKYGSGLLAARIVDEAIELKHEQRIPENIYQYVNDKIDLLESGVQKGEYEIINYLMFAIPNLGFIGTIIGIVLSMANVSGIIESSAQLDQLAAFDRVGGALGLAFDTTAVSLLWVLVLSLLLAFVKKMEADMFEALRAKTIVALKYYWGANDKL